MRSDFACEPRGHPSGVRLVEFVSKFCDVGPYAEGDSDLQARYKRLFGCPKVFRAFLMFE